MSTSGGNVPGEQIIEPDELKRANITRAPVEVEGMVNIVPNSENDLNIYPDDYFDTVRVWGMLHYANDPYRFLQQVWRHMKPDGLLLMMVPHGASDNSCGDPDTAKSYFPETFQFFTQPMILPGVHTEYTADFTINRVMCIVDQEEYAGWEPPLVYAEIKELRNKCSEIRLEMLAKKPARPREAELRESLKVIIQLERGYEEEGYDA